MVGVLWVPPPGGPPGILVLRRQPAGIWCVCRAPSGMLSEQVETHQENPKCVPVCVCVCVWESTDRLLHSPVIDL